MKKTNFIIWINRTAGIFAIMAILLCAGFYFWIHSRSGMAWLASTIRSTTGNTVQLTGLSGRLPYRLHIEQLQLADDSGSVWLLADKIDATLNVPNLLKKDIILRSMFANQVIMNDVPHYHRPEKSNSTSSSPAFIKAIRVENAVVNTFTMNSNVSFIGFSGPVKGSFQWQPDGIISASVQSSIQLNGDIPLDISGQMDMRNRNLIFKNVVLSNDQDLVELSGLITLTNQAFNLDGEFNITELTDYASIIRVPLRGPLSGRSALTRLNQHEPWTLDFKARSDQIDYAEYSVRNLEAGGKMTFMNSSFQYDVSMDAESINLFDWTLLQNRFHGRGDRQHHHLSADVSGWENSGTSTTFKSHAELVISDSIMDVLNVSVSDIDFHAWSHAINTNLPQVSGRAELSAGWTNNTRGLTGQAVLKSSQIKIDMGLLKHFEDSSLCLTARVDDGVIRLFGEAEHPLLDHFSIEASVPIIHTNKFVPIALHQLDRMETRLKMSGNLKKMGDTILTSPMAIGGQVLIDMNIVNPLGVPRFDGSFVLTNGQYRRLETGTFLDHIDLVMTGAGNRLSLSKATATDGGKGLISASGYMAITNGWKPSFDIHTVLTNASLLRIIRTDLPLSGNIHAGSSNQSIFISGNIWLEPFRFVIPKRLPPSIPVLQVVEINHPRASRPADQTTNVAHGVQSKRPPISTDFNIGITTRRTFVVAGRGLSSEWRGEMKLHGTSEKPQLTGQIKIANGYAMLLGRRFNIDDGVIQLTGEIPPNPAILASASTRIGDTVARLVASGTIQKPKVDLTSDPLLPNDEIMALILFGKEIETMTPWQAIALANGLSILSGSGDLVDVIDNSQSLIQVDQIDIKQDEEGEGFSSIAVGKYIGRSLYVEGEKGFGEADDSITVTLELSPRLVLETEASPRIREGIGLYWRREY